MSLEESTKKELTKEQEEEIKRELLDFIKKERHISAVASNLDVTELEILGLADDLIKKGNNIIVKRYDDGFHLLNNGDSFENESETYSFKTDDANEFKFVAISDTRLGSKSQQLAILNDIYRKAQEMGIKHIFLCGNISAGLKTITDTESNFIHDSYDQIDYIIENYPKYEGITTYFISGREDDKHLRKKNINIGKRIAEKRPDMVYLGEDLCDVTIDRVKMQVMSSKLEKTYTVSYRIQQTIDALRSEDKPDILLYGGLLQMEKFKYRDVISMSIPSVCATDKEMKAKRYANTIGAWYVTVETDQKGNLKSVNAITSPYYVSNKDDYKGISIKAKSTTRKKINVDNASVDVALRLYNYAKNDMPVDTFMEKFHISPKELQGLLHIWEYCGKKIDIIPKDNEFIFKKTAQKKVTYNKVSLDDLTYTEVLVVSDTHFGNNHNQLHLLNELYQEAYNRGITTALHVGDLTDGTYHNRPESIRQQFLHGFDEQVGYVEEYYPYIDGMTTYYILGSHDETHYKNGQATVNRWLSESVSKEKPPRRPDMVYLGQDIGEITISKVKYVLDHPGAGSTKYLSYKGQQRIEILEPHTKPKILLIGHYHKSHYMNYRNIQCIQVPCLCGKTQFQQKQGLINSVGGYFLKVWSDKKGNVQYLEPEEIAYDQKDLWDEAGKDKSKVRKLCIKKGIY